VSVSFCHCTPPYFDRYCTCPCLYTHTPLVLCFAIKPAQTHKASMHCTLDTRSCRVCRTIAGSGGGPIRSHRPPTPRTNTGRPQPDAHPRKPVSRNDLAYVCVRSLHFILFYFPFSCLVVISPVVGLLCAQAYIIPKPRRRAKTPGPLRNNMVYLLQVSYCLDVFFSIGFRIVFLFNGHTAHVCPSSLPLDLLCLGIEGNSI